MNGTEQVREPAKAVKVDLDSYDESLVQEQIEINPDINPNAGPLPISDGKHRVRLVFDPEGTTSSVTNSAAATPFISCQFSAVVLDDGPEKNRRTFSKVNTLVFDGKSEMGRIIQVARGDDQAARDYVRTLTNYVALAKAFREALATEPVVEVRTRWEAQAKNLETGKWDVVKAGQKQFPSDGHGGYIPTIQLGEKYDNKEVNAKAVIKDYFAV